MVTQSSRLAGSAHAAARIVGSGTGARTRYRSPDSGPTGASDTAAMTGPIAVAATTSATNVRVSVADTVCGRARYAVGPRTSGPRSSPTTPADSRRMSCSDPEYNANTPNATRSTTRSRRRHNGASPLLAARATPTTAVDGPAVTLIASCAAQVEPAIAATAINPRPIWAPRTCVATSSNPVRADPIRFSIGATSPSSNAVVPT